MQGMSTHAIDVPEFSLQKFRCIKSCPQTHMNVYLSGANLLRTEAVHSRDVPALPCSAVPPAAARELQAPLGAISELAGGMGAGPDLHSPSCQDCYIPETWKSGQDPAAETAMSQPCGEWVLTQSAYGWDTAVQLLLQLSWPHGDWDPSQSPHGRDTAAPAVGTVPTCIRA